MCTNRASLGEQGHNGKARALGRMGEPENRGWKAKSTKRKKAGPTLSKPAVLIGAPSNGKQFLEKLERSHSKIDAWQAEVRENRC